MNSGLCHIVGKAMWAITAISAVVYGLMVFDIDVIALLNLCSYKMILQYIVGIAGLYSLVMLLTSVCSCSSKKCC